MKCTNCGFESQDVFQYCSNCGVAATVSDTAVNNTFADKILAVFKDNLFLALCVLMTASCVFSLISNSLPVINILITIFLWLTYAKVRKGIVDANSLRCISGSVYANYVIVNVISIIFFVCGIIVTFILGFLTNSSEAVNALISEFNINYPYYTSILQGILAVAGWVIGLVFIIVAVAIFIINILGMKKIHRFAKSVYKSVLAQNPVFENLSGAKNWLIFFGVCSAISTLSSLSGGLIVALTSACSTAAIFIAVTLINKYFVSIEQN